MQDSSPSFIFDGFYTIWGTLKVPGSLWKMLTTSLQLKAQFLSKREDIFHIGLLHSPIFLLSVAHGTPKLLHFLWDQLVSSYHDYHRPIFLNQLPSPFTYFPFSE